MNYTKNGPITFFETPLHLQNTVAVEKATDFSSLRLSYTNYNATGIAAQQFPEKK